MKPQHIKANASYTRDARTKCGICGEIANPATRLCDLCEAQLTEEWQAEQQALLGDELPEQTHKVMQE